MCDIGSFPLPGSLTALSTHADAADPAATTSVGFGGKLVNDSLDLAVFVPKIVWPSPRKQTDVATIAAVRARGEPLY
jgi:hypothetical protein